MAERKTYKEKDENGKVITITEYMQDGDHYKEIEYEGKDTIKIEITKSDGSKSSISYNGLKTVSKMLLEDAESTENKEEKNELLHLAELMKSPKGFEILQEEQIAKLEDKIRSHEPLTYEEQYKLLNLERQRAGKDGYLLCPIQIYIEDNPEVEKRMPKNPNCWFCPFGHYTECHFPFRCSDMPYDEVLGENVRICNHYLEEDYYKDNEKEI